MDETASAAMESLREAHRAVPWQDAKTTGEFEGPASEWVEAFYRAFQAVDEGELRAFAEATAEEVVPKAVFFWPLAVRAGTELERLERHGEWARFCHWRSALEVVRRFYHGLGDGPGPFEAPEATAEASDDLVEEFAEEYAALYESEIPPYIPTSHWWWWAPDDPPESRA